MKKVLIVFGMAMLMAGCSLPASTDSSSSDDTAATATPAEAKPVVPKIVKMDNGLEYEILKEGKDPAAVAGDNLVMHYTGWLTDGTKFDSSVDRGEPFHFTLGGGQVIPGWDTGIVGMKVGEKRKLTIPAELGYGPMAIGSIPANSVLIFEVELLENRGTAIR